MAKKCLRIKAEKLANALETAQQRNKNLHLHRYEFHFDQTYTRYVSWDHDVSEYKLSSIIRTLKQNVFKKSELE